MHILDCTPHAEGALPGTSERLAKLIHDKRLFTLGTNLHVSRCESRQDILSQLRAIGDRARAGSMPLLHLDGHASPKELAAANDERVDWDDVYALFRAINIACGNNLFVSMGLCEALGSIDRCRLSEPCPVAALLAAWDPLLESHVEIGFQSFYAELVEKDGDIDAALAVLQRKLDPCPLMFFSSKYYFEVLARGYVEDRCIGPGFDARVNRLLEQAAAGRPEQTITREMVTRVLAKEVENTPAYLRWKARRFLHMDASPENEQRFAPEVEAVIGQVEAMLGNAGC